MYNFFKLFLFLINIDTEMVFRWFSLEGVFKSNYLDLESLREIPLETFRLLIENLSHIIQDGLSLSEIDNALFLILFLRFIILAVRYNIKTSFFITCIGLIAGYLWYNHFIGLIYTYKFILLKFPFFNKFGVEIAKSRYLNRQSNESKLENNSDIEWYKFGQIFYYGLKNGIKSFDKKTLLVHYIDPISMIVSNLPDPIKVKVIPYYYSIYNLFIPKIVQICKEYWDQISGILLYTIITRVGKKYCPYLIRWHWTLLLILKILEPILIFFIYRVLYFQTFVLIPQMQFISEDLNSGYLTVQITALNLIIGLIVTAHIGFVLFAIFHAICGQYFYTPFLVENTELHVGPRPKNSIYSGGQTAWQNSKDSFPKLWYGWFGRGTEKNSKPLIIRRIFKWILNKFNKFK